MYYSFKCTYCGRLFYTYSTNKHAASEKLYKTIKQHLIDYDEDRKEHEMDDGETADSEQIYHEMSASTTRPAGGYEATNHGHITSDKHTGETSTHGANNMIVLLIVLFLLVIVVISFFFFGGFQFAFLRQ